MPSSMKQSNNSITYIYIAVVICIIAILSYFLFNLYKKYNSIDLEILNINKTLTILNNKNVEDEEKFDVKLDFGVENEETTDKSQINKDIMPSVIEDINTDKNKTINSLDSIDEWMNS